MKKKKIICLVDIYFYFKKETLYFYEFKKQSVWLSKRVSYKWLVTQYITLNVVNKCS